MQRFVFVLFLSMAYCAQVAAQAHKELFFISDTQGPVWVETIVLKTENNRAATKALFADMAQAHFSALFHLGDMVSTQANRNWAQADGFTRRLRAKNIPVYAIPGNHEYMFFENAGRKKFVARFGYRATMGYVQTIDSVAVVLLNSNFGTLTGHEQQAQMRWYMHALDSLDRDRGTKTVIVCTHHSPYTNSSKVDPSAEVSRFFVPKFMRSRKARLFLSGHSHNLEYFQKDNKHFLVIGGGGGLLQPLLPTNKTRYSDRLRQAPKPRFFYLKVRRDKQQLRLEVRGFRSGDLSSAQSFSIGTIDL